VYFWHTEIWCQILRVSHNLLSEGDEILHSALRQPVAESKALACEPPGQTERLYDILGVITSPGYGHLGWLLGGEPFVVKVYINRRKKTHVTLTFDL